MIQNLVSSFPLCVHPHQLVNLNLSDNAADMVFLDTALVFLHNCFVFHFKWPCALDLIYDLKFCENRGSNIFHLVLCDHPIAVEVVQMESPPGKNTEDNLLSSKKEGYP